MNSQIEITIITIGNESNQFDNWLMKNLSEVEDYKEIAKTENCRIYDISAAEDIIGKLPAPFLARAVPKLH